MEKKTAFVKSRLGNVSRAALFSDLTWQHPGDFLTDVEKYDRVALSKKAVKGRSIPQTRGEERGRMVQALARREEKAPWSCGVETKEKTPPETLRYRGLRVRARHVNSGGTTDWLQFALSRRWLGVFFYLLWKNIARIGKYYEWEPFSFENGPKKEREAC